jgi:hypothetical protein
MSAPTERSDGPDFGVRNDRLARVSQAARALAVAQAGEQLSGNTTPNLLAEFANSQVSLIPERDQLLDPDVPLASSSRSRRRSGLAIGGLAGFVSGVALTAVVINVRFPAAETWSQPAVDRTIKLASALSSATPAKLAISRLIVQPSRGTSGEPAPLGLALHGPAEAAVVIITGFLPGMDLSTGEAFGGDAWRVPASDLPYAWVAPPNSFTGSVDLVAELRLPDDKIADRQVIHIEWLPVISPAPAQPHLDREPIAAVTQETHQKEIMEVPPISLESKERQLHQEGIATIGSNGTLRISEALQSSEPVAKEIAPRVSPLKGLSQLSTRKARRNQDYRRVAAQPDPWRGDGADVWIAPRYPKEGSRHTPSAAAYTLEGTPAAKEFWDWSR